MKYYPALWYDIGPQTAAARNACSDSARELFAENFIKRLNDWCAAHGLQFGGHLDQEEPVNPAPAHRRSAEGLPIPEPAHRGRHLVVRTLERFVQDRDFGGV